MTGHYLQQWEWLKDLLDDKGAFNNGSESHYSDNDDENQNQNIEATVRRCTSKQAPLKILQVSLENTSAGLSFK